MKVLYTLENLTLNYGEKLILRNLTLEIRSGLTSLIGPNGAGKTSLLRVLAGLEKYSGSVKLKNSEIKKISRKNFARSVSFVMSEKNFRPSFSFTVREIMSLGHVGILGGRLKSHDLELIENAAELLKISHLMSRNIMTLSDGERQLAFIAAGLARDTEIILLDEPTAALDPDKAAMIFSILRKLADDGKSIIVAVHDINTAGFYSDFFIALKNGKLIFDGLELNQKKLKELYDSDFMAYHNDERNDLMWRVIAD